MIPGLRSEVRGRGRAWDDDLNLDYDRALTLDDEPVCASRTDVCGGVTSLDGFDLGPVKKTVVGGGLDNVVERLVYGEEVDDATDKNLKGRLYQHFDQAGRLRVPFYDLHGQVGRSQRRLRTQYKAEASWPDSGGWNGQLEAETFQTTYQYDALARVEQVDHPDGSKVRPRYHQSGRLRRVRVMAAGESTWSNYVVNIKYSAKSQRETILYGNGTRTDYRYDPATFRLEYLRTKRTGDDVTLQRITYVYDPVGNVVRITDDSHQRVLTNNQSVEPRQNYTYDALYRLVAATGREHPALNATSYKDPAGFKQSLFTLLNDSQQLSNYTRQYEYDAAGSLKTIVHVGHNNFTRELAVHDFSNRALLKTDTFDPDTSADWVAAGYFDANGNQTKFDHLVGATWNYRDNLGSVTLIERTSGNDDTEYYVYDAAGQRVRKVKETFGYGETVEYVSEKIYLGGVEIKRERSIDLSTMTVTPTLERADLHVMDDKQRIAIVNRWTNDATGGEAGSVVDPANPATYVSKQRYQYGNHLGSASLELDDAGLVISYEEYFPYGGTSIIAGNSQAEVKLKEYRYTGKERDDTSGFYYHGARYFAPWTGRWMSADPAGPVDGLNLYEYARSNPILFVDFNGRQSRYHRIRPGVHIIKPRVKPEDIREIDISHLPEEEQAKKAEELGILLRIEHGGAYHAPVKISYPRFGWIPEQTQGDKLRVKVRFRIIIEPAVEEKIVYFRDPTEEPGAGVGETIREHERLHAQVLRSFFVKETIERLVERVSRRLGIENPEEFFSFAMDFEPDETDAEITFAVQQEVERRKHYLEREIFKEHEERQQKEVHPMEPATPEAEERVPPLRLGVIVIQGLLKGGYTLESTGPVSLPSRTYIEDEPASR